MVLAATEKVVSDTIKCCLWMTFGVALPMVLIKNILRFASGQGSVKLVYELALKEDGQNVVLRCLGEHVYEVPIREIYVKERFMLDKYAYHPVSTSN